MKMSDVFDLPVSTRDYDYLLNDSSGNCLDINCNGMEGEIAHAINNHDALVEALEKAKQGYNNLIELGLLPSPDYEDCAREYIQEMDEALGKAKS